MPLAYMNRVLEHLVYGRRIKDWTYVGGKWAGLGHFEFKSLDGTDSGRMLEGDRIFVAKSVVKELGITQRLWMEDGAVEYGPREIVLARVYNPDDVDDLQSLVVFGQKVEIEKSGVLENGHNTLNSLVVEYLGREGEDRFQYLGWVNAFVLSVLEKMVLRQAPEPVVQDFDGDKVWGVRDETREAETWAFVDYLDTKYPKTWFVARRMLTVTTGA